MEEFNNTNLVFISKFNLFNRKKVDRKFPD